MLGINIFSLCSCILLKSVFFTLLFLLLCIILISGVSYNVISGCSGPCYKRQMQPLSKTSGTPFVRKPHSIRLVEIPPTSDGQRGIKLSVESARGLPVTAEPYGCRGLRISE